MAIRVAVVGGGLAGTILMNALVKHTQLDVQLYEANSEIKERGASIGLSINAQRAMRLIGLEDVTRRAMAVKVGCLQLFVGEGPDAGKHIYDVDFGKETVHRAALLRELLVSIPKDHIHLNRRLSSVHGTTVTFEDGSSVEADVIIGADGIHSHVRKFVLGEGHPAINPVAAGFWDARAVVSRDEAVAKLGDSCINVADPHQHMHIGGGGVVFHDIIDDGERVCVVVCGPVPSDWDSSQWKYTVTREWCDKLYAGWGEYGSNALDLVFGDKSEIPAFMEWESAATPTLYNETVCMIGDAAHATTPWQGSGLSQAIEDSLILERVLGRCQSTQEVPAALQAYDQTRRAHAQKVVDSSRKTAEAYFGSHNGGVEQLRRDIPSRQYILHWDTEGAIKQAVDSFERTRRVNTLASDSTVSTGSNNMETSQ